MRLTSPHRRRLEQLLQVAGGQAVAIVLPWLRHWRSLQANDLIDFLSSTGPASVTAALDGAASISSNDDFADCRQAHLLEELLAVTQSKERRRRGVYYTPLEIVRYIVRQVDRALVEQLGFQDGLADARARILDPAAGSGLFLAEVIRTIHSRTHLLPRLTGWEIMPEGVIAAHCLLAEMLRQTGYRFADSPPLPIELRDALAPPTGAAPFNVVIGNPPYASLSTAAHGWIEGLIKSADDGYLTVDGQPLGEKKHWLHDDYVKFLRLAQWHVQQSGSGVVGLVTNHGYLENPSFRGMRASLLQTFPRIEIVDLHGNAKQRERSPDGSRDENVFGIALGAAIGIFARSAVSPPLQMSRTDLWGTRSAKLEQLDGPDPLLMATFSPTGPHYRFSPPRSEASSEYAAGWRLCDAMPLNTTAPVTARDHFVVAFSREELIERMAAFRDLTIPDDEIRQQFFTRTRSSNHPPGDSRGWKLSAARQALVADAEWQACLRLCQYRPLDYRHVLWHDALIDWPRRETLRHLLDHDNLAIIARRQSPAGLPANYFWATRRLALDGIVRSDNRGSESLFPLWRFDDDGTPRANFAPQFIADCEQALGLSFVERYEPLCSDATRAEFTPLALAGYLYGLFWSSNYRLSNQQELSSDFPRILLVRNAAEFFAVSQRGLALLRLHTQLPEPNPAQDATTGDWHIAPGYPRWQVGQVWINSEMAITELSPAAWEMQIGAHQVARKWLKDRRGRRLTVSEVASYRWVAGVLNATCELNSH